MGRSLGFGSTTSYLFALFRLRFRCGYRLFNLTLHEIVTRRSILQKVRHHPLTGFDLLVGTRFQVLFSLPFRGAFPPFPHGTGSLSVTREYLALGDGPPGFRRNFSCSAVLRILVELFWISHTGAITLCCATFQLASAIHCSLMSQSYNPKEQALWFGLFPFRSPLLRESNFLSLPAGNEMFQFPACSSIHLCIQCNVISYQRYWVAPFGNLRIKAYLQLPGAYRC